MLTRNFSRQIGRSIRVRASKMTAITSLFSSEANRIRADAISRVRTHNHPAKTPNTKPRILDPSLPDIRMRANVWGANQSSASFGPAFDVISKKEFSIQQIKKITDACGSDDIAYGKHFKEFMRQGKVWQLVLLYEHIEATGAIKMKRVYVNYLLTACREAKDSELAFQTLLKYSDKDYVPNEVYLLKNEYEYTNSVGTTAVQTAYAAVPGDIAALNPVNIPSKSVVGSTGFLRGDSYQIALTACAANADCSLAHQIVKMMMSLGAPITVDCWNAVLNTHAQAKDSSGAFDLLLELQRGSYRGIEAEPIGNTEINVSIQTENSETNVSTDSNGKKMKNMLFFPNLNMSSYNIVMKAYARSGEIKKSMSLFQLMTETGYTPDNFTWCTLLQAAITANDMKAATAILDDWLQMVTSGIKLKSVSPNHMFNAMITAHSKRDEHSRVEELYRKMLKHNMSPNELTYTSLITSALENNRKNLATEYFIRLIEEQIELSHSAWRVITAPLGRNLDSVGIQSVMEKMRCAGTKPSLSMWKDLIGVYGRRGECVKAAAALRSMYDTDGVTPDHGCFIRVIRTFCEYEYDWEKGLALIRETRELNMHASIAAWQYVVEACVNSTFVDRKFPVKSDSRKTSKGKDNSMSKEIDNSWMKKNCKMSNVFALLDEMQEKDKLIPDSFLWNTIVNAFSQKKKTSLFNSNEKFSPEYESLKIPYSNNVDTYFNYFYQDESRYRITEEMSLLQKFLSMCTPKNSEIFISELMRPLLLASLSVERVEWGETAPKNKEKVNSAESPFRRAANYIMDNYDDEDDDEDDTGTVLVHKSDVIREMLKKDTQKILKLLMTVGSESAINYCDLLRLCANIGETGTEDDLLGYVRHKGISLPSNEVTELLLFTYFQNGELELGLDYGFEILKRNEILLDLQKVKNTQIMVEAVYDDEFDSDDRKLRRKEHLRTVSAVEKLIEKSFLPSCNFYTILFAICGTLGKFTEALEFYDFYEGQKARNFKKYKEVKIENMNNNMIVKKINEIEIEERFYHSTDIFIVDSFVKSNELHDGHIWALDTIVNRLNRRKKNDQIYDVFDLNNRDRINLNNSNKNDVLNTNNTTTKSSKSIRNQLNEQEIGDLLMPILRVYLKFKQSENVKKLLQECRDLKIPITNTLISELLLKMSCEGSMSGVMEILLENNNNENTEMSEKLHLWEIAFLGCVRENNGINSMSKFESFSDQIRKRSVKSRRRKVSPEAKADQGLRSLKFQSGDDPFPVPSAPENKNKIKNGNNSITDLPASVSFAHGNVADLWDPILQNRSENGDLDGCLEVLHILRESSLKRTIQHWEKTFSSALLVGEVRRQAPLEFISKPSLAADLVSLLQAMLSDGVQPTRSMYLRGLNHFASADNPSKVVELLKMMKKCGIAVDNDAFKEINHMRRLDIALDMYEDL